MIISRLPSGGGGKKSLILPDNAPIDLYSYDGKIVVKWQKPTNSEVSIASYNLYWIQSDDKPTSLKGFTNKVSVASTATEKEVTGLTDGKMYWFALESVSSEGYENASMKKISSMNAGSTRFLVLKGAPTNNSSFSTTNSFGIVDENMKLLYSSVYGDSNVAFGACFYGGAFFFVTLKGSSGQTLNVYKITDYKTCTLVATTNRSNQHTYNDVAFNKNTGELLIVSGISDIAAGTTAKQDKYKFNCKTNALTVLLSSNITVDGEIPKYTGSDNYYESVILKGIRYVNDRFFSLVRYWNGASTTSKFCYSGDGMNWSSFSISNATNFNYTGFLPSVYYDSIYYNSKGYSYDFKTYVNYNYGGGNTTFDYVRRVKKWLFLQRPVNDGIQFNGNDMPPTESWSVLNKSARDLIANTKNDTTLIEGGIKTGNTSSSGPIYLKNNEFSVAHAKITDKAEVKIIYAGALIDDKGSGGYTMYCVNTEGEYNGKSYGKP